MSIQEKIKVSEDVDGNIVIRMDEDTHTGIDKDVLEFFCEPVNSK